MTRVQVSRPAALSAAALVAALALSACGGDDDTDSTTTPSTSPAAASSSTTTAAPIVTQPTTPPTTEMVLVTEGAKVVVANASSINGTAGRMSDALAKAGFTMGAPTNSSEKLSVTKVYYSTATPEALAVAESIVKALGGGEITVAELATPAPLQDPDTLGDATVLVALGSDAADKTLAQLQGRAPDTTAPGTSAPGTTAPPTSAAG